MKNIEYFENQVKISQAYVRYYEKINSPILSWAKHILYIAENNLKRAIDNESL